jgi:DNA (cytosine-5)-methyltransferase 1
MRLLDLFCKAGGAAVGYHRAGFDEIVGIDIEPQKRYPFEFVQCDALEYVRDHWMEFDAIHASPPCQAYSISKHIHQPKKVHPDLVSPTRVMLERSGLPWVIENVPGSPLKAGPQAFLCGLQFGLRVLRHRFFETSFHLMTPSHPMHPKGNLTNSRDGYSTGETGFVCAAGNNFSRARGAEAMGIDWPMTREEVANAIPPAYTEYIGRQLLDHIRFKAS